MNQAYPNLSDEALSSLILKDDEQAIAQLMKRYNSHLFVYAFRLTENSSDAEDLVQIVWNKLWFNSIKIKNLRQWLFRVLKNQYISDKRKKEVDIIYDNDLVNRIGKNLKAKNVESDLSVKMEWIEKAMESLSEKQRIIFSLHYFDGMTYKEIATHLDLGEGEIRGLLYRTRNNIRLSIDNRIKIIPVDNEKR